MRAPGGPTLAPMSQTTTEVPVPAGIDPSKIGQLARQLDSDHRGREVVFDVEGLSVSYGGALALDGVSLEIRKGFVRRSSALRAAASPPSSGASTA